MNKIINMLLKIGAQINEYYDDLIDLEIAGKKESGLFLEITAKIKEKTTKENALISQLLEEFNIDSIFKKIEELSKKLNPYENMLLDHLKNKLAFINSVDNKIDINATIQQDIFLISLAILDKIMKMHPEIASQLIVSIYYSYFNIGKDLEAQLISNNFEINKNPIINIRLYMDLEYITNEEKDKILFESFKEHLKILLVYITRKLDSYLIYYQISFIRAIITIADNKELFLNLLDQLLSNKNYEEAKRYIEEILANINSDKEIPIYASIKVGR